MEKSQIIPQFFYEGIQESDFNSAVKRYFCISMNLVYFNFTSNVSSTGRFAITSSTFNNGSCGDSSDVSRDRGKEGSKHRHQRGKDGRYNKKGGSHRIRKRFSTGATILGEKIER